ncbi:MAG TPA: 2-oxo-4-hydroxy-4-carboxy-5-ureidoimidazoline decarboxylase [Jatrophihabitans sp.]|jgi:2-oxo-4-hydroxy-4-carboxy-5-ureidoimidazoline decarboxylase|uniref:2-oxo-4-hydroxy-4-carboxy-5-ureidoimidazoline decarboxylase n=1 Tax=Jatrophihabitans sp. TaxID=1932789 RepID=UPI002E028485|nr:2-oxo-4-hydroxy-4-carboxy-5-ureidoimidazoline decarboxylase [Jatrophihabitans sp.]
MTEALIDTTAFDRVSTAAAELLLRPACASVAWIGAMAADRPYENLDALTAHSAEVIDRLGWPDVEEALAAHPRIGERASGDDLESAWSQQEQSGSGTAEQSTAAALRAGNVEYEQRFGHVFLICATGRSAEEMLAALRERIGHDEASERAVVRAELTAIVRLRLAKILR